MSRISGLADGSLKVARGELGSVVGDEDSFNSKTSGSGCVHLELEEPARPESRDLLLFWLIRLQLCVSMEVNDD